MASHGEKPLIAWDAEEITVGIFSHTRPIAKKFLRQIQQELETNQFLMDLFPDILYVDPRKEAPMWSLDGGLIVKRNTNPKEATIEAWGLVDSQPTSAHYSILVYDDVVTQKSVNTPEMIQATTQGWELSQNLGKKGGFRRTIGTRYHYNDTYSTMISRKSVIPRVYPATIDGSVEGKPVFLSRQELTLKRRDQGPYTFACQMLQNPKADETQGFIESWLKFYKTINDGRDLNTYILVDPAGGKRKTNDYTSLWVIGLGADRNYYALDFYRDRLNLTQRADLLFNVHERWTPLGVGYEKYALQADIEHFNDRMERENYRFDITPLGGPTNKNDRIKRLIPICEQGRLYLPIKHFKTDYEGETHDLVHEFINQEYKAFPVSIHDDMLDGLARITDQELNAKFPFKRIQAVNALRQTEALTNPVIM